MTPGEAMAAESPVFGTQDAGIVTSAIGQLDPAAYQPHALHGADRAWSETNCYVDVWVEVLHALQLDPVACLAMLAGMDFDGDQWTFFKPSHDDLWTLYGIDVQELNVWRSLLDNTAMQLHRKRLVLTEADAYHLPDTAGTDYRQNHVKTTIAIHHLDVAQQTLMYFHNRSLHQLQGEDFVRLFRVGAEPDPGFMPFFAEFVRCDHLERHAPHKLATMSRDILRRHLARRPALNPLTTYREQFITDMQQVVKQGLPGYHAYAFANLRQLGAGADLLAVYLNWLTHHGQGDFAVAAPHFSAISDTTKIVLLKMARAISSKKPQDFDAVFTPLLTDMEQHWELGMTHLTRLADRGISG